jgi:glycosyltransferase involved in cell wall biosynthesis
MAAETARKATAMTAVSPYTANHFRRYMFYRGEMPTIPNGIPAWIFALGKERRRTVTHAGITYATVLSGWDRLKNGRTALVAFSHLRPAIPDARFILFGHGHGVGEEGHVWAEAKGLAEGVEFAGQTPHAVMLQRLAREVDLLLHPSLEESFSMAVIEGMALGIPVIGGARSGAVPTTIGDAGGGVLVDVRSSSAMSGAMLDLAFHSSRRIAMGVAARESAIQRFAIGSVAVAYEREYSALASQR